MICSKCGKECYAKSTNDLNKNIGLEQYLFDNINSMFLTKFLNKKRYLYEISYSE